LANSVTLAVCVSPREPACPVECEAYSSGAVKTKKEIELTADRRRQTPTLFTADWPNKNLMAHGQKYNREATVRVCLRESAVYTRFPVMAGSTPIPKELKRLGVRRMYPAAIADEETIRHHLADNDVPAPGAFEIAGNLITLPTHMGITESLAKEIAQKVQDAY
jgi:hypothetical protein